MKRQLVLVVALILATAGCASQNVPGRHAEFDADSGPVQQSKLENALHDYYEQWQGVPYAYGGRSQSGIDCSSFVRHTFAAVESYELPRTTVEQAQVGISISRANLKTGDLVFFHTGHSSHHVGVYLGQGRFMHVSSRRGVTISRLDNIYWRKHYWQSRHILAGSS
ncbi:MAG: NlpC/P60 family protein [Salinisphaera sp.]|jgi:cell wall-associated NlpC family hydrolase|nr:NlpC/P60 family protein [Salinisphaera sp.]